MLSYSVNKGSKPGKIRWFYIILFIGLGIFRFAYLDQDAPVFQLSNICQEDEPYYSEGATLQICKDDGRTVKGFQRTKSEVLDMYSKPITYASYKLLGNNYWGLRVPDVLMSIAALLFLFLLAKEISPGINYFFLLFLLSNFYLFTFSRYNNPQISSVLDIAFTLWILVRFGWQKPGALFLLGFFCAFATLFIYPMNFFFSAGLGVFIMIKAIGQKKIKLIVWFAAGVLSCFILLNFCLFLIGRNLLDLISLILGGGSQVYVSNNSIVALIKNSIVSLLTITNTGYFRFQLPMLLIVIAVLPIAIYKVLKDKDRLSDLYLVLLLIMAMQFIQNCYAFNYGFKKMLVDIPVTAILFLLFLTEQQGETVGNKKSKMWAVSLFAIVGLVICIFNFHVNKSEAFWRFNSMGCFGTTPEWFDVLNIASCIIVFGAILYAVFYNKRYFNGITKAGLIVSVVANLALTCQTYFVNKEYKIRDSLISLKPMLENKIVSGDVPYSFQLYTNCKPGLHAYDVNYISKPFLTVMDSMINNGNTDFVVNKVVTGNKPKFAETEHLNLVKVINFDCYSYYVYKNELAKQ